MKKLLAGLLLVSSVLSFGATQRVPIEKLVGNGDGQLLYLEGENKPYSGEVERKYPNGKLLGVATMKNGKLEGKAYEYYENGKVKREETYVDGKANGVAKSFYENGQVEGVVKAYDENGKLIEQATYKNGEEVK